MSLGLHKILLRDSVRMRLYEEAIKKTIKGGEVVIDLGCGTGIMGFLALKYGAKKVYAIEAGEIIHLAKALAYENGLSDKITFINKHSSKVKLPERADVVISEILGTFGVEEKVLPTMCDMNKRLLKKDARSIPRALTLRICPVSAPKLYRKEVIWNKVCGIKVGHIGKLTQNFMIGLNREPKMVLARTQNICVFNLRRITKLPTAIEAATTFNIIRGGVLHGFAGWFAAELAPGVILDGFKTHHWRRALFPIYPPQELLKNDRVYVKFLINTGRFSLTWFVKVARNGKVIHQTNNSTDLARPKILAGLFK